ncbi:hypothetical protein C2E23DRAFT_831272 [Lenzites betulinus]|nr:hypothetical protein C2E23DRAFT_831272 [Lenzites betulinus]
MQFAFGFGRRTCPGRFLADALLFSHYAHILAVFDVSLPPATETAQRAADAQMKVMSNGAACRVEEVYVQLAFRSDATKALVGQPEPEATTSKAAAAPASSAAPSVKSNAAH